MCVALPGTVLNVVQDEGAVGGRLGLIDFHGSQVEVSLAMVPEATAGSWVLVHAGYAITVLDETEARETWKWLQQAGLVDEIHPVLQTDESPGAYSAITPAPATDGEVAP